MNRHNADYMDWAAVGSAAAVFFNLLPDIVALVSLVWLLVRLWETETVRKLTNRLPAPPEPPESP